MSIEAIYQAVLTGDAPEAKAQVTATVEALTEAGLRDQVKVLIGGAPVTQEYADQLGADGFAPDASSASRKVKELVESA